MEILNSYSEHGLNPKNTKAKMPKKPVNVTLPKQIADQLNPVAMKIGEQFRLYGFRAKINFRSLLKCLAYMKNKKIVTEADFQEFLELADYMNFDYNPI
jgi:hypothetical protein